MQTFYTKSVIRTLLGDNDSKYTIRAPKKLFYGQQWNIIDQAGQSII